MLSPRPLEQDEVVFLGGRMVVSCEDSMGFPPADILWSRDGRNISSQGAKKIFFEAIFHTYHEEEVTRASVKILK